MRDFKLTGSDFIWLSNKTLIEMAENKNSEISIWIILS